MKISEIDNYPLGFNFPRRVKVIAKRINLPVNQLIIKLEERGVINCNGATFLDDNQLLKIEDIIEKRFPGYPKFISSSEIKKYKELDSSSKKKFEEIFNKIQDYEKKINTKRVEKVARRSIKKNIPTHLREFYLAEIKKLKKQLENVEPIRKIKIEVQWNKIVFENYKFRVYVDGGITEPYEFSDSRESFNLLRSYFSKLDLKPLKLILSAKKILEISNIEEIYKAVQIFKIKEISTNYSEWDTPKISEQLKRLKNSFSKSIIAQYKSNCLNHLSKLHDEKFKIIPIFENSIEENDSFIFTVSSYNKTSIIWESCLINKATYIFHTSRKEYFDSLLQIIELIHSEEVSRMDIRQTLIKNRTKNLEGDYLYHDNFNSWKQNLALKLQPTPLHRK